MVEPQIQQMVAAVDRAEGTLRRHFGVDPALAAGITEEYLAALQTLRKLRKKLAASAETVG